MLESFRRAKGIFYFRPNSLMLRLYKEEFIETNASDTTVVGVISWIGNNRLLYPVAYFSTKINAVELNYNIYDKELLTIIRSFEE